MFDLNTLSQDQQMAVLAGSPPSNEPYRWIALPEGPQPHLLPSWLKDVHIDYSEQYSNSPSVSFKVTKYAEHLADWSPWSYNTAQKCWYRTSTDGLLQCHYHSNKLTWYEGDKYNRPGWITHKSEGYGGRRFYIEAAPEYVPDPSKGTTVILWGPWHGSAPPGYMEVSYYVNDPGSLQDKSWKRLGRKWYQRGGYFGLYVTVDLYLAAIARFAPTTRVVQIKRYAHRSWRLELVKEDWPAPKGFFYYHNPQTNDIARYPKEGYNIVEGSFDEAYALRRNKS